jgi:5'-3' exonuclease
MGKLLAIDGLNIVRRIYEANTEPDSPEKAESVIQNCVSAFRKLLATHAPTHVLAAFDFGGPTWRHDLHPSYREHRTPMPVPLLERLPALYGALERLGVHVVSIAGVEADDVIGTAVLRWLGEGRGEAVIASTDQDLHALIADGAMLWDHFKGEWHDRQWVENKFGVPPELLTDLLALMGKSADSIPGVSKVGIKTAARLIQSYTTLEGVMAGAGILKDTLGEKLRQDRDNAFLSRQLVKLKTDVHLGVSWKTLAYAPG